jgi:hypothetical protein
MLATDETEFQLGMMRLIIYWLTYKLGGQVDVDFEEMKKFFNDKNVTRYVMDTPTGLAFKVSVDYTDVDIFEDFGK